jgi:hypothetical protein
VPGAGHDVRLGSAVFLDGEDMTVSTVDRRIAGLVGTVVADR